MAGRKTFVILGLGIYGSTLAEDLVKYNHDVIAVDKDMACVERIADSVSNAICLDFTDIEQLRAVGAADADVGIIATSSHLEEAIIGVMNLKELGVHYIVCKAKNKKYAEILSKIGANKTVMVEKESARREAKQLSSSDILDLYEIDAKHTVLDMNVKKSWIGKSIIELNLRNKLNINVIGIKRNNVLSLNFDPSKPLKENDVLLVVADNDIFKKLDNID